MNTIYFSQRHNLGGQKYVMLFSTNEIEGINVECRPAERSDAANRLLNNIADRITLALDERGYEVTMVNFRNMAITAMKRGK